MDESSSSEEENNQVRQALGTSLTLQEIQVAINFLKKRFPRYTIDHIVSTLDKYNSQKKNGQIPPFPRLQSNQGLISQKEKLIKDCLEGKNANPKETSQKKKQNEIETKRIVSNLFCEHGDDYETVKRYFPEITPTYYKSCLLSIANSTLNEIIRFLRNQCKIKIKDLSQPQKITIKTAILNSHSWMGKKSMGALQTLLKFISKKFTNKNTIISNEEAIQLYKIIAYRINDKTLDLLYLESQSGFGEQVQPKMTKSTKSVSIDNQNDLLRVVAEAFLQFYNVQKIVDFLLTKYGLLKRFSKQNVQFWIKRIIHRGLIKLKTSLRTNRGNSPNFNINDELINQILQAQHLNSQYALVQLFLSKQRNKSIEKKLLCNLSSLLTNELEESQSCSKNSSEEDFVEASNETIEKQKSSSSRDTYAISKNNPNHIFEQVFGVEDLQEDMVSEERIINRRSTFQPQDTSEDSLYFED